MSSTMQQLVGNHAHRSPAARSQRPRTRGHPEPSRHQPGRAVLRHKHPGEVIIYVLEGSLEYRIDGKPPTTLNAGDVLLVPAETVHAVKNVSGGNAAELATYVVEKGKPFLVVGRVSTSPPATAAAPAVSFGPLRQIDAGLLNVGYVDAGPADGPAVLLLHGWPYDIHSYAEVAPLLAAAGYRVIVPYLRGYGTTRFLSDETFRNGEQAALAVDAIALAGRPRDRQGGRRRLRLGRPDRGHRRGALARALQGARLGQRLSDRQPGSRQAPVAAGGRAPVVVPVLLRDRTRPGRLRQVPARLREAHLADRLTEVELRRRHLRSQRSVPGQPGSRRDRDSQLSLAARAGRRRA